MTLKERKIARIVKAIDFYEQRIKKFPGSAWVDHQNLAVLEKELIRIKSS